MVQSANYPMIFLNILTGNTGSIEGFEMGGCSPE
jgi:hypothetical protein